VISQLIHRRTFDDALAQLQEQFPNVPQRILNAVLSSYLAGDRSLSRAADAARARIIDACAVG
jgi:hypothetical protein